MACSHNADGQMQTKERDRVVNQQEGRLSWFAGILDGEGSISVQVYTLPDGRVRLTPFISIVNSDIGILEGCREVLRDIGVKYRDCQKPVSGGYGEFKGRLECKNIRIDGQEPVEMVIKAVLPYLRSVKKQYAKVVLEYLESRKLHGLSRDHLGRVRRCEYRRWEIEMISSIRTHKKAKSLEAILQAPNVLG
jgi:hypothetical protein